MYELVETLREYGLDGVRPAVVLSTGLIMQIAVVPKPPSNTKHSSKPTFFHRAQSL